MKQWIPFGEGEYLVEQAYLMTPDQSAVMLEDSFIKVYTDATGMRQMNGRCFVQNYLVVELLENNDRIDLLLNLGGEFKYLCQEPLLHAGKVFAPKVKASLQFTPSRPWNPLLADDFDEKVSRLRFISAD
jgi:hypothetical protein